MDLAAPQYRFSTVLVPLQYHGLCLRPLYFIKVDALKPDKNSWPDTPYYTIPHECRLTVMSMVSSREWNYNRNERSEL